MTFVFALGTTRMIQHEQVLDAVKEEVLVHDGYGSSCPCIARLPMIGL